MQRPSAKRLPRTICTDTFYSRGLVRGSKIASETRLMPQVLEREWHRGHTAGMFAATQLLAEQLGITL